eukprot:10780668-Ditylum_brightwellii.AAC.1
MSSLPYGGIITLTKPPCVCNVTLTELRQKWIDDVLTWDSDHVSVIPLKYDSKCTERKPSFVCGGGSMITVHQRSQ